MKNIQNKITPLFDSECATIVTACSNEYVNYFCVLLKSMLYYSNPNRNYEIILLNEKISEKNINRIKSVVSEKENFFVRFVHINDKMFPLNLDSACENQHFTKETFYRICFPNITDGYKKIIYIDVDIILQDDIYKLWEFPLKEKTICACRDLVMNGWYNQVDEIRNHLNNELKLKNYRDYFQCGVMIIDVEKYKKSECQKKMLDLLKTTKLKCADQDLFNILFENDVNFLPPEWNYENECYSLKDSKRINFMDEQAKKAYLKSKKAPKIIHYVGSAKPWAYPDEDLSEQWWFFARMLDFYPEILERTLILVSSMRTELRRSHLPNIAHQFGRIRAELENKHFPIINYHDKLLYVMQRIPYFELKKFMYKLKKSFSFGERHKYYQEKYNRTKKLIKDAKALKKQYKIV